MNTNKKIMIVSLVLIIGAFYGGMKYGQTHRSTMSFSRNGTFTVSDGQMQGAVAVGAGGRVANMRGTGGVTFGEIISKDTNGITVKLPDGGSKIILIASSTVVSKEAVGSQTDLTVGKSITVTGTPNSDGSITAGSIQLRPAMSTSTAVKFPTF